MLRPSENIHRHLELAAFRIDFLDHAAEVEERAVVDLHGLAGFKIDLGLLVLLGSGNLLLDLLDFVERSGVRAFATHETDGPGRFLDEIIGLGQHPAVFVQQGHVDVNVAGMELALGNRLLATTHFDHLFDGQQDLLYKVHHLLGLEALLDALLDLLFLAGKRVNDKPVVLHCYNLRNKRNNNWSTTMVNAPSRAMDSMITTVEPFNSSQVGQVHFFNSSRVWR